MHTHPRTSAILLVVVLSLSAFVLLPGADGLRARAEAQAAAKPQAVALSTRYKVDPDWPQRPDNVKWGDMPGIAVDTKDQVWLFTRAKPPIQVYSADGKFIRAWGQDVIGKAHGIGFDPASNVWVADNGKHVVMQFTPEGKLLKTLGTPGKTGCDETHFNQPTDMAITAAGDVFVSDGYGNNRVVHFDKDGKFVKAWGRKGFAPGEFDLPHGIALDSKGRLYVTDRNNGRVQVFDQSGKFLAQWAGLMVPWGFHVTPRDEIWVCGSSHMERKGKWRGLPPKDQVLVVFNPAGKVLAQWRIPKGRDGKEQAGEVNWLHAVALDSKGNIYVGDIRGRRAQKFVRRK